MCSVELTGIRLASLLQRSLSGGSSEIKLILRLQNQGELITFSCMHLAYQIGQ